MFEHQPRPPNQDPYGLYRWLVEMHGQGVRDVLVRRLIRRCQKQSVGLLGDAGLKNLWEEICIAIRTDHPMRDLYESHLETHLTALVLALPVLDQQTLWLTTYEGTKYANSPDWTPGEEHSTTPWPSLKPSEWPLDIRKVAIEIINDDVLYECVNYDNKRIRAYEGR